MNFIRKGLVLFLLLSGLLVSAAAGQSAIFIVRHAEKAVSGGDNPNLSTAGHLRAKRLARVLRNARITRIFVTEFNRTRQTAAPLAQLIGLNPQAIPANNTPLLISTLRASSGNLLVVAHSNTIPEVISGFGITTPIQIGDSDYDNMFVLLRNPSPHLIRLHYH